MIKQFFRGVTALSLALTLLLSSIPAASAASFQDVPQDYWASREISDVAARGLLQGSGGTFQPEAAVSKQAFLSAVCRAAGLNDHSLQSGDSWADPAIAFALYFGWLTEEALQDRTVPITRELAVQILIQALLPRQAAEKPEEPKETEEPKESETPKGTKNSKETAKRKAPDAPEKPEESETQENRFSDQQEITEHRKPFACAAAELGLIPPETDGAFHPQKAVTRAEAAVMLSRALKLQEVPSTGEAVQVPILMYHDISYLGYGYSKTPEIFRKQLQELKDAGFHTVFLSQVEDFVRNGTLLPSKPIVITLDDGYASNYQYVYPILQELEMKAEISVIGDAVEWAEWGIRWDQLREMSESGLVSVQSHTQNLHTDLSGTGGRRCTMRAPNESWRDYVRVLGDDTRAIRDSISKNLGTEPLVYTYPMGKWSAMGEAVSAQLGFRISLTTRDGVALVRQGAPSSLRLMNRIGMDFRNGSVLSVLRQFGYPC